MIGAILAHPFLAFVVFILLVLVTIAALENHHE